MALKFAIQTVFEIVAVVLIIYGFCREDKLIAFEDDLKAKNFKQKGDKMQWETRRLKARSMCRSLLPG